MFEDTNLQEIKNILEEYPSIKQVIVKMFEGHMQNKYICVYIEADLNNKPSIKEIRAYLHKKMPEYIIPSRIAFLDEFQALYDCEIDNTSLPNLEFFRSDTDVEYVAPRSTLENILCKIWSNVLNVDMVGVYDNFFNLGGHPTMAILLVSKIRSVLRSNVPISAILNATPTIEQTALAIEMYQFKQFNLLDLEEHLNKIKEIDQLEV